MFDEAAGEFLPRATFGMDETLIAEIKDRHIRIGDTAVGIAAAAHADPDSRTLHDDPSSPAFEVIVRAGFRALLAVPLLGADRVVGALVVRRQQPGEFPRSTVDLLQTFAAQSVLAIQNANLFARSTTRAASSRLASQHKSQFLANMSHELRTPLERHPGLH